MKYLSAMVSITTMILVSCSNSNQPIVVTTVEVTRIAQITTTPVPTYTLTPTTTPDEFERISTHVAESIGTPIIASDCYKATDTQDDINNCSNTRRIELELQMSKLVHKIEERYAVIYGESTVFNQLQAEWEDFVTRECEFRSGRTIIETDGVLRYQGGSMALASDNECLVVKYEDRLRELQILLYNLNL